MYFIITITKNKITYERSIKNEFLNSKYITHNVYKIFIIITLYI